MFKRRKAGKEPIFFVVIRSELKIVFVNPVRLCCLSVMNFGFNYRRKTKGA